MRTELRSTPAPTLIDAGSHLAAARAALAAHNQTLISETLQGRPELLLGALMTQLRDTQTAAHAGEVDAQSTRADKAQRERQDALFHAEQAAQQASGFLGLGKDAGLIAGICVGVAAVAATVATGGTAVAIAGAVLVACADPLSSKLAEAGVISPEHAKALALGLKVTGGLMMGGGVVGVVGAGAATYAGEAATLLEDVGVDASVAQMIGLGLSVAGAAAVSLSVPSSGTASAAKGVSDGIRAAAQTTKHIANAGALVATEVRVGAQIAGGVALRESADARADAVSSKAQSDEAFGEVTDSIEAIREGQRSFARAMQAVAAAQTARGESLRAASSMRG